jgi:type VI secretion system secreted protein VgrG
MPTYTQDNRPLSVRTPLGKDVLLLVGLTGHEAISRLFNFQLDLLAEDASKVKFDKLLGQKITVALKLPNEKERYFNGICNRISQGGRSEGEVFTAYHLEIVPQFWLLARRSQSRIFQHVNVPDILKSVLAGLEVTFEIQGTFHPRDYCVQYRESDFNFASRLMEEEGIFYFFKHTAEGHKMVVANTPDSHLKFDDDSEKKIIYEEVFGGYRYENRILGWEKIQELRSGKYTLWDHCFELPHKHLEGQTDILESVQVGNVDHKLQVGDNGKLEIYDFPGAYAQRFDGVDKGGGDQAADLQNIFEDNKRTTKIRMEAETVPGLVIRGGSNCRHLVSGYQFTLDRHFDADGDYVLTELAHTARLTSGDYRSGGEGEFAYENHFTCIPFNDHLPFRPPQTAVKPTVTGTHTAVVTGPAGEEIFTDKYGRVKVQFHWDRQGRNDADSSCWIRVGTIWAGKQWGVIHIPRIGQEVIVDFLEGDPDQPIIVGSVYNADQMPPYKLPDNKTQSGVKSRSSKQGGPANFNEFRFEDKKGQEQVFLHAEKNQDIEVENDETHWVGHDRRKTIDHDETTHVKHDRTETVDNNETITIGVNRTETVGSNEDITIGKNRTEVVAINESLVVGGNRTESVGKDLTITAGMNISESAPLEVKITAGVSLTLKGPGGMIIIDASGVTIQGVLVKIN